MYLGPTTQEAVGGKRRESGVGLLLHGDLH